MTRPRYKPYPQTTLPGFEEPAIVEPVAVEPEPIVTYSRDWGETIKEGIGMFFAILFALFFFFILFLALSPVIGGAVIFLLILWGIFGDS